MDCKDKIPNSDITFQALNLKALGNYKLINFYHIEIIDTLISKKKWIGR
jgi:hypothetical protein